MSTLYYRTAEHFSPQSPIYCSHYHGARKDSWHHCRECRNKTAKWQSSIAYRYLRNYDSRQILVARLNVVNAEGNEHLTIDETKAILSKFHKYIKNHFPQAGYLLVLEASPNGRPHWHGIFLSLQDHEIGKAWGKACKGFRHWSQVDSIKATLSQAVDYLYKPWGENRSGCKILLPKQGVKIATMFNFFKYATKAMVEGELKALKPRGEFERQSQSWKPDDIEDEMESRITRHKVDPVFPSTPDDPAIDPRESEAQPGRDPIPSTTGDDPSTNTVLEPLKSPVVPFLDIGSTRSTTRARGAVCEPQSLPSRAVI